MSAEIKGKIIGEWEMNAVMGGDELGLVQDEYPFLAQEVIRQIQEEERVGLVPKGKRRGILFGVPTIKNGRKVMTLYKIEFSEGYWR